MAAKIFDLTGKRIYVAGHRGMVGSAIVRRLEAYGYDVITVSREEVDLDGGFRLGSLGSKRDYISQTRTLAGESQKRTKRPLNLKMVIPPLPLRRLKA